MYGDVFFSSFTSVYKTWVSSTSAWPRIALPLFSIFLLWVSQHRWMNSDFQNKKVSLIPWFITIEINMPGTEWKALVRNHGQKPQFKPPGQTELFAQWLFQKKNWSTIYIEGWHWTQWPCLWWAWMWALDRVSVSLSLALLRLQAWATQEQVVQSIGRNK
jgi:hypothetical protein